MILYKHETPIRSITIRKIVTSNPDRTDGVMLMKRRLGVKTCVWSNRACLARSATKTTDFGLFFSIFPRS